MNFQEYLLTVLSEDAGEIVQSASKINRFGPSEKSPDDPHGPTNVEQLVLELNDLLGVAGLLAENGVIPKDWAHVPTQLAKRRKVLKYCMRSIERGCLSLSLNSRHSGLSLIAQNPGSDATQNIHERL